MDFTKKRIWEDTNIQTTVRSFLPNLYQHLNPNPRLQFHRKSIVPDDNLLKPPPGKALVKLGKLRILLLNEIIQLVDTLDLFVTDGGVGEVLLFHLTKSEYLIGDVVVVLLAGNVKQVPEKFLHRKFL